MRGDINQLATSNAIPTGGVAPIGYRGTRKPRQISQPAKMNATLTGGVGNPETAILYLKRSIGYDMDPKGGAIYLPWR